MKIRNKIRVYLVTNYIQKTIYIYALIIFEKYHIKINILVYRIRMTYHQTRKNTVMKNSNKQLIVR